MGLISIGVIFMGVKSMGGYKWLVTRLITIFVIWLITWLVKA